MGVEQGLSITVGGGLDKTSASFDLFKTPGAATRLLNFESSTDGGYRRVNGYSTFISSPVTAITVTNGGSGYVSATVNITDEGGIGFGAIANAVIVGGVITAITVVDGGSRYAVAPKVEITSTTGTGAEATASINLPTTPDGTTSPIQGLYAHEEGGLAVQDGNIYWSENGYSWIQVNKDYGTCNAGGHTTQYTCELANNTWTADYATEALLSSTAITVPLDSDARYTFTEYLPAVPGRPRITICNGSDPIAYFETYMDSGTRYFKFRRALFKSFGLSGTIPNYEKIPRPQFCEVFDDHLVVGGDPSNPANFYYSDLYDDTQFDGATAGEVNISGTLTGLKVFRDTLIVFGRNGIRKFVDINGTPALIDVTKNIGCIDGFSIQEIGGDLVFLAPDGIRTVAATTRIDDIELSSISSKIQPIISYLTKHVSDYQISSAVIRTKNQYRLFYTNPSTAPAQQKGITGTFKISASGAPVWEWTELKGFPVACLSSGFDVSNVERIYQADYNGNIQIHDFGNSFDGQKIYAEYKTPDIDYGDVGIRKTLHYVKLSIKPEGTSEIKMDVRYDFEDAEIPQPNTFEVGTLLAPSLFGSAIFGVSRFGTPEAPMKRINLWGSGFSNSFKFYSNDTNPPYSIQGMYVDLIPSGRR